MTAGVRKEALRLTVLIVCRNEARALERLLSDLGRQTLPAHAFEVVVVDGCSRDGSREAALAWARRWRLSGGPDLAVLENARLTLAPGWNAGVRAARAPAVLRLDAHARVGPRFLAGSLALLSLHPEAWAAGGRVVTVGEGFWGQVNAALLSHPFGVGGSRFRTGRGAGWADTVPYAAYRLWVFDVVGPFDEDLARGEDLAFHARLRRRGGRLWLDPEVESVYVARPTLVSLLRKAWGDGFWNPRAARRAPGAMRPYHFAPPAYVLSLIVLAAAAPWLGPGPVAALFALHAGLAGVAAVAAARARPRRPRELPPGLVDPDRAPRGPAFALALWLAFVLFHLVRGLAALVGAAAALVLRARPGSGQAMPDGTRRHPRGSAPRGP